MLRSCWHCWAVAVGCCAFCHLAVGTGCCCFAKGLRCQSLPQVCCRCAHFGACSRWSATVPCSWMWWLLVRELQCVGGYAVTHQAQPLAAPQVVVGGMQPSSGMPPAPCTTPPSQTAPAIVHRVRGLMPLLLQPAGWWRTRRLQNWAGVCGATAATVAALAAPRSRTPTPQAAPLRQLSPGAARRCDGGAQAAPSGHTAPSCCAGWQTLQHATPPADAG